MDNRKICRGLDLGSDAGDLSGDQRVRAVPASTRGVGRARRSLCQQPRAYSARLPGRVTPHRCGPREVGAMDRCGYQV